MTLWELLDRRAERRTKLVQERWKNNAAGSSANIRDAIGIAMILAFVSMLFMLVFKSIPKSNEQLIVYMLGQLSGFVSAVVALHYVQKAGEKELDQQRVDNTSKALDAIKAAAEGTPPVKGDAAGDAAEQVAEAAADEAEDISGRKKRK